MARKLRYIPDPPTLVSITCRTVQGRFLFRPGPAFNDRFLGILGRAQRRHKLVLNAVSTLSNHFHVLAVPESARQLAAFMRAIQAREADFSKRFSAALTKWTAEAAPLKGIPIAVQHHAWIYMENWLGLHEVVPLEPKPGVPPSSGYLAEVLQKLQQQPAKFVIRAAYEDDRPSTFISEKAGIPAVVLPFTVGGTDGAKDLFGLYEDTIHRMLGGLKK